MSEPLELEIITANSVVLRDRAIDLYIPAFLGEAGVLSHHLPYITALQAGEVSYLDTSSRRHFFYVENGFLEVRENRITMMADAIVKAEEFSGEELRRQIEENDQAIQSSFSGGISPDELEKALDLQKKLQLQLNICTKAASR